MGNDDDKIIRFDNMYLAEKRKKEQSKKIRKTATKTTRKKSEEKNTAKIKNNKSTKKPVNSRKQTNETQHISHQPTNSRKSISREEFDYREYLFGDEYYKTKKYLNVDEDKLHQKSVQASKTAVNKKAKDIPRKTTTKKKSRPKPVKKQVEEKKNKPKKNRIVLKILLAIIVIAAITIPILYFLITSTYFNIQNISAEGELEKYTAEQIVDKSEIHINENIFKLDYTKIKWKLLSMPYLDSAKVKIQFPNTIKIVVTERKPYIIIKQEDSDIELVVDKDYRLLEFINEETLENTKSLPKVENADIKYMPDIGKLGQIVEFKGDYIMPSIKTVLEEFQNEDIKKDMSSLKYNVENLIITMKNGTIINFGKVENLSYKVKMIKKIIEETKNQEGIIDLNKTNPTFIPKVLS